MKVLVSIAICILFVVVSMPTNSDIDTDGKLTAHATAKKSNADKRLRCLTKSMCDDKWIVNGWWGMTIQIDDTTWDRPDDDDEIDETPQYSGKLYKRMYKRERTHNDSGYSWAYVSGVLSNGTGFYAGAYDGDITK